MNPIRQIESKIISVAEISRLSRQWKAEEENIVFTNGCFDLIHRGHIDYLAKAAALGTKLIIGLNTDSSVSRLKGESRPFQDERSRAMILAALFFVDRVVFFDTDTPYELIRDIRPDVLVKGNDYNPEDIVGYDIVTSYGGTVKTLDYLEGHSTTHLVTKIKNSR